MNKLDKLRVRQSFSAAVDSYDSMAGLQQQVARNLVQQTGVPHAAERILDLGCGTGFLSHLLLEKTAVSQLWVVDIALPMLNKTRHKTVVKEVIPVCADAEALPFLTSTFSHIYSSLALQWCPNLPDVLKDLNRVLVDSGRLCFATFGPATLQELKQAWRQVDDYSHVNDFYSESEIRQWLKMAGFKQVNMHSVIYRNQYPDVMSLMKELKGIGARNALSGRNRKLTTRSQLQKMIRHYPQHEDGSVNASYEIIFVNAVSA